LPDELYMRILQILRNIKTEIDTYKQNDVYVLRALLYEVLMLLDREYKKVNMEEETTSKEVGNIHINKFMKLVESHLTEQHSVQYYADKLCITPNYLNEIVTSTKGISAKQYIRNKVMDEAKRLLTYTDFPISDIAFELHFSTVSYFIRSFRQHTGETPLLYRKTHKP
jgi:transcriptional regulator